MNASVSVRGMRFCLVFFFLLVFVIELSEWLKWLSFQMECKWCGNLRTFCSFSYENEINWIASSSVPMNIQRLLCALKEMKEKERTVEIMKISFRPIRRLINRHQYLMANPWTLYKHQFSMNNILYRKDNVIEFYLSLSS